MTDTDPLADRLRELGRQPVAPATSSQHLTAMAAAGPARGRFSTKVKVGLAFGAGLLVGGTGLASAGALPAPAQKVAHSTLSKVGVNVPGGTARFNDPAVCGLDPTTQKLFRNHGQYVKAHKGDPAAAESRCGKPLQAGTGADDKPAGTPADPAQGKGNGNPGVGNGKGNNGNGVGNGGNKNGKPDKAKDPGEDDKGQVKPATPAAPATTAKPAPTTPTTAAAPTTTAAPATTTTAAPATTTTTVSPAP